MDQIDMKKLLALTTTLILFAVTPVQGGPIPLYENFGTVTNVPQIDAVAFANYGDFTVFSVLPYDMQNTRFFTNRGVMFGLPGFRFDYVDDSGVRRPAESVFNANGAEINTLPAQLSLESAQLILNATNIVNRGAANASAGGLIRLEGGNVDVSRSGLQIEPIIGGICGIIDETNFFPDLGIFDQYWGLTNVANPALATDQILQFVGNTFVVDSGAHRVTNAGGFAGFQQIILNSPTAFIYTNAVTATNWIVQAAFVSTRDTNIFTSASLYNSTIRTNRYKTIVVQFSAEETNVVTGGPFFNSVYIADRMASETNFQVMLNQDTLSTYRPSVYEVARIDPSLCGPFLGTAVTNAAVVPNLLFDVGFSNIVVTNAYAAYGFFAASTLGFIPAVPGVSVTNLPGRIEITADNLNMERTRMRGESVVNIRAKHLVTSSNSVIDVPNLALGLASTNGLLSVQSIAKENVIRTSGPIRAYSAMWTNQMSQIVTNIGPDPMDPMITVTNLATNTVDIGFHIFLVDASLVQTRQPVSVVRFEADSTNVVISDTLRITDVLRVKTENLTINGKVFLGTGINDWAEAYFPGLKNFTNSGGISIPGAGFFGSDRPEPYTTMVNSGTNAAFGHQIRANYFENSGLIIAGSLFDFNGSLLAFPGPGAINLNARNAKLEGGEFEAGGDITLQGTDLKFHQHTTTSGGNVFLNVTNSLADSGPNAQNVIETGLGVHLLIKPAIGDLFGTRIEVLAPRFALIGSTWAADDRGPDPVGYLNNAVIGRLVIDGNLDSFQEFSGAGAHNALYIDFLEIGPSYAANLENAISINPNLVIYFADSNVPVEQLDGMFGGRLRWVSTFAGPNSSVDVLLSNGQTVKVNRALRESQTIDSDGDGIPNFFDLSPFDGVVLSCQCVPDGSGTLLKITWKAAPRQVYQVEYSPSLVSPGWQLLRTYTNTAPTNGPVTVEEPLVPGAPQLYYRVRYNP